MRTWMCFMVVLLASCSEQTPIQLWVDGFQPENVRFEIANLGPLRGKELGARTAAKDIDGAMLLAPGSCPDVAGCRVVMVSVFVSNNGPDKEPPPVVRLAVPPTRAWRPPVVFQASDIDPGRIGRIRWLVELWPEEQDLTATLSASVRLQVTDRTQEKAVKEETENPVSVTK